MGVKFKNLESVMGRPIGHYSGTRPLISFDDNCFDVHLVGSEALRSLIQKNKEFSKRIKALEAKLAEDDEEFKRVATTEKGGVVKSQLSRMNEPLGGEINILVYSYSLGSENPNTVITEEVEEEIWNDGISLTDDVSYRLETFIREVEEVLEELKIKIDVSDLLHVDIIG